MTVGSLFSGIGGLDLGFERAGCKTIWVCEKDKHCKKLLADKFPRAEQYSDVKHLVTDFDPEYSTINVPTAVRIVKASRNIKWEPLDVQAGIERTLGKFFF